MASRQDIEALRQEAGAHGDPEMVAICDLALDGDEAAHRQCECMIDDAIAAQNTTPETP